METIIETILQYVEPDGEIGGDSSLKYDCGLTSFDSTCVIGDLCARYGVSESDLNVRKIATVRDLYEALEAAAAARNA